MSIKFPASPKSGFSPIAFLFILFISIFTFYTGALAQNQSENGSASVVVPTGETVSPTAVVVPVAETGSPTAEVVPMKETASPTAIVDEAEEPLAEWEVSEVEAHNKDIVKRGERFFRGLLPHNSKQPACVSCHNLTRSDTLNWNPSAMEIANKYFDKGYADFYEVVMQPEGDKMAEVHKGYQFEEADLKTVKAYLDHISMRGQIPESPNITPLLVFVLLSLIMVWALLDLIIFRKIKYKAIPLVILIGVFSYQVVVIYEESVKLGRSSDYEPDQPIKFSHKVHAGQNKIDCRYCHFTAEQSKSAGIPPMDLCLNCHSLVREGTRSGRFEIAKVIEANEKKMPVEWIRIHDLPDHVFFSHAQHVNAGKLDCKECHGDVAQMDVVRQVEDLSMGWCLDCHRKTEVQFANNDFYKSYENLHEQIKSGKVNKVTVDMIGGTDCMKCHY
jgi:hypothetical protein